MYDLYVRPTVDKIFKKMIKKDRNRLLMIHKKVEEIRENPFHEYKHLRKPLEDFYRVHIDSNFVLIFAIDHNDKSVILHYFGHHDVIYQWRPKNE